MRINAITNYSYQPKFNGEARMRLKNDSTALLNVQTNRKGEITDLTCDVWLKQKQLQHYEYQWEEGLDIDDIRPTVRDLGKKLGLSKKEIKEDLGDYIFDAWIDDMSKDPNDEDLMNLY